MEFTDYSLSIPQENNPESKQVDTRTFVDRMFADHSPEGKHVRLPVRAQNGSKIGKLSDIQIEPNTIPVILSIGSEVEDFTGLSGLGQGEHLLCVGGVRQGKAGQGKIFIPLNEVNKFCENLQAVSAAITAKLPELLNSIKDQK